MKGKQFNSPPIEPDRYLLTHLPQWGNPKSESVMSADNWHVGVEASTDDRGRLSLGKLGIGKDQRFRMDKDASGVLTLVPVVSIPAEELLIWENEQPDQISIVSIGPHP